ncbi:MAG: hypothetical protein OEZ65_08885 [Gemmatimonadota bacterium]|nr:hypothetical protein [Gemmatimonadota bacterium]MDH5759689.1 hypothetical protein [Gemmatimonadota bacterium]
MTPRYAIRGIPVVFTLVLLAAGCASSGQQGGRTSSGSGNVITAEELEGVGSLDLLTAIQRLRPRWLQSRGSASFSGDAALPRVILDGVPQNSGLDVLRTVRAVETQELRYMSASDATTRYGTDMVGGAILVIRKR